MLKIIKNCRVSMITFGGKQFWTAKVNETFTYNFIVEQNDSYTIIQSGLNFYVFESKCIKISD